MNKDQLEQLKSIIRKGKRIVFFGGAGVSTESGIPDFRSQDGLYNQRYTYPPETIISHSFFLSHPDIFWQFYREKMLPQGIEPNITHKVVAKWEEEGRLLACVTQNIDDLHEKAGTKRLYKLHGTTTVNHCMRCGKRYDVGYILSTTGVPKCSCGGMVKPDVVLYEENLDDRVVEGAVKAIEDADVLLVCGTSLVVYPAAGFIQYYGGDNLILINRTPTPYDGYARLVLHDSLGEVFTALADI